MTVGSAPQAWIPLHRIGGDDVVLVVDIDATGRPGATFRDLSRLLPDGVETWHVVPPPASVVDHIDWWTLNRPRPERPVRAVLGYCAGCAMAAALADAVEQDGRPPVVLFDPALPSVASVHADFTATLASMISLSAAERAAAAERLSRLHGCARDDLAVFVAGIVDTYLELCGQISDRLDIDDDVAQEMTRPFRAYMAYLLVSWRLGATWAADDIAVTSRSHDSVRIRRQVAVDVDRHALLRAPQAVAVVRSLLAGPT